MSDFNIKVTVRNAHLLRAIRAKFDSAAEFSRASGIGQSHLSALITMRESPLLKNGFPSPVADLICDFLGKNFEELWPGKMAEMRRKKASHEVEMSIAEVEQLADPMNRARQRKMLSGWAGVLRPRELQAITLRIEGATIDEGGAALGVSRERFRQIEAQALRKMRRAALLQGVRQLEDVI
jgi:lambda repressor-like predicted transcriptional regulator